MSGGRKFYQINYLTPTYISCWNWLKGVLDTGTPHDKESRKINFTSFTRWGMTKRSQVNVRSHTGEGVDPLRPLDTILSPPLHRWLVFHIIHYPAAATLIPHRTVMAFLAAIHFTEHIKVAQVRLSSRDTVYFFTTHIPISTAFPTYLTTITELRVRVRPAAQERCWCQL